MENINLLSLILGFTVAGIYTITRRNSNEF